MDIKPPYRAIPIPGKKSDQQESTVKAIPSALPLDLHDTDLFSTVEVSPRTFSRDNDAKHQELLAQSLPEPLVEENDLRSRFRLMRQIAGGDTFVSSHRNLVFYRQAMFMEDFEDDYEGYEAFSSYYPYYQLMTTAQLRTYFTWRTQVRQAKIVPIDLSYVFLYLYECINQVGVMDTDDGLAKMMAIREAYIGHEDLVRLERYLMPWIKDYHVFYQTSLPLNEFITKHQLEHFYPLLMLFSEDKAHRFDACCRLSAYAIQESIFYSDETKVKLQEYFEIVVERINQQISKKGRLFLDLLLYTADSEGIWIPFTNALFYINTLEGEVNKALSPRERYTYRLGHWTYTPVILTEAGREVLGLLMREIEIYTRLELGFRYRLKRGTAYKQKKTSKLLKQMKIDLPKFVVSVLDLYRKEKERTYVHVIPANLKRIRWEANDIQEQLIVEEEADKRVELPIDLATIQTDLNEEQNSKDNDPWDLFSNRLDQEQIVCLEKILNQGDFKGYIMSLGILLEVYIDQINEIAFDTLGDAILDLDEEGIVFEDYIEDVKRVLEG